MNILQIRTGHSNLESVIPTLTFGNVLLDLPTSENHLSDVGMYNNRFPNVNVGI